MCEVEEQQAARVEVQGPKTRVIRVESEEAKDYVRQRLAQEETSQEEADEIGFVPAEPSTGATTDAVKKAPEVCINGD